MRQGGTWRAVVFALLGAGCGAQFDDDAARFDRLSASGEQSLRAFEHGNARAGRALFSVPVPSGNGRSCATCHDPEQHFTLTPAEVEARYRRSPRDPLFRPLDADDYREDYSTLRRLAAVRAEIVLHPNVRDLDDPAARSAVLFRGIPSIFNVALTAPYQLDGRAMTLEEQARGAIVGHSQPTNHGFPPAAVEHLVAFELEQFSSEGVLAVAEALASGEAPEDPDPPLDSLQQQGKTIFQSRCARCHGGPRGDEPRGSKFSDVLVSSVNLAGLPVRRWVFTLPDGSEEVRESPDPGLALLTGELDDFEKFEIPQVRGIRFTAPYFHDNGAATLDEVLAQYNRFFASNGRALLTAAELDALRAYLEAI